MENKTKKNKKEIKVKVRDLKPSKDAKGGGGGPRGGLTDHGGRIGN
jgi:hypothetical protein